MKRRLLPTLTILFLVACCAAVAWWRRGYERAVESGRTTDVVRQFDRLFPNAEHYISYCTGEMGPATWNSAAGLHGRYVLTMQMPITLDGFGRGRVATHGPPTFYLQEVRTIVTRPDGGVDVTYGGTEATFGLAEWGAVVKGGGDLTAVGVTVRTDAAVVGFDKRWRGG